MLDAVTSSTVTDRSMAIIIQSDSFAVVGGCSGDNVFTQTLVWMAFVKRQYSSSDGRS
jgi:hypothetical protein